MKRSLRLAVLAAPLGLLVLWALAARTGWPSPRAVPPPIEVGVVAARELLTGRLWRDIAATLARTLAGVGIATLLGFFAGWSLGRSRRLWRAVEPTVDFLRAVPPLLVFPVLLLGLGYGEQARVAAVIFGTTGTIMVHVAAALERAPRERAEIVRLAGFSRLAVLRVLEFPEALPSLLTGVRIALAQGLVIASVSEMLVGAEWGLGARALQAQLAYRADLLYTAILLAGLCGTALSAVVARIERRVAASRATG